MGDVNGDLSHRRGRIVGMDAADGLQTITAEVPQAELFHYCAELRSMTGGRGSFETAFARYEVVPSNVAQKVIAEAQKVGGVAAFIDAEHALDVGYARKLGVNIGELLISQPDTGEQALEIAEQLVRSGACDILVVDSVAALVPKAEIEGDMGDPQMGLQARLMSQAMRKLTSVVSRNLSTVVFINQIRMKIGVVFGNPETTTGGQALKFYSSVRLDIRRIGQLKEGEQVVGSRTRVKVVKNKVAPPFREAEFDVRYGVGVDRLAEALDLGVERGIVEKSGAHFSLDGERIGQGRERASEWLREHPVALESLVARIPGAQAAPIVVAAAS
jgi:recombination protein RecA